MLNLDEFWILWCPTAEPPPKVRFSTEKSARESAEIMSKRHFPNEFIVMKSVASCVSEQQIKWIEQKKRK